MSALSGEIEIVFSLDLLIQNQRQIMTSVVTQACIGCKDKSCINVCPVDCFHEGPEMLYINPDDCIGCRACTPECPVDAIFDIDDVPEDSRGDIALNEKMSQIYPRISP